jgi:hypothetical protein
MIMSERLLKASGFRDGLILHASICALVYLHMRTYMLTSRSSPLAAHVHVDVNVNLF